MVEAIAEIEGMDSVSRAGPNLHYGEDCTYQLQDTPLKKLMEPDPQLQTGEWHNGELQDTEDQFHRRTRELEIERLWDIRGEPEKRADHWRRSAMEWSQEVGWREARSRSISHRRNLSASWDRDSPPPPPAPVVGEEKANPKEKELHSVAHNKVVTNPRAKSIPRKVKDVMTHRETQDVARSPACQRMKMNLREPYPPLQSSQPTRGVTTTPSTESNQGGEGEPRGEGAALRGSQQGEAQPTGYPSTRRVKKNQVVKQSVDINEKPNRKKGRIFSPYNPKPTKAQLLAEPITHRLYFKADKDFK